MLRFWLSNMGNTNRKGSQRFFCLLFSFGKKPSHFFIAALSMTLLMCKNLLVNAIACLYLVRRICAITFQYLFINPARDVVLGDCDWFCFLGCGHPPWECVKCLLKFIPIHLCKLGLTMVDFDQPGSMKRVLKMSSAEQAAVPGSWFFKKWVFLLSDNRASLRSFVFGTWNT